MTGHKKAPRKRTKPQIVLQRNAVFELRAGVILGEAPSVHLHPRTADRLGLHCGDYLEVIHGVRDTQISRCLCCCPGVGIRQDYVYMDEESFRYLLADLHDPVSIRLAEHDMDMP